MQCEICKKTEATIHLTEIVEGERSEMHLCENCAVEQGVAIKSNVPINELLSNLLSVQPSDEDLFGSSQQSPACPDCGFTLDQFREEAVLGCPNDYEIFDKQLSPLIKKAHNNKTTHCGKVPSRMPADTKKQIVHNNLQQQLEIAVHNEDYETAAKLRDEIAGSETK